MKGSWKAVLIFLLVGFTAGALAPSALEANAPTHLVVAFVPIAFLTLIGLVFGVLGTIHESREG